MQTVHLEVSSPPRPDLDPEELLSWGQGAQPEAEWQVINRLLNEHQAKEVANKANESSEHFKLRHRPGILPNDAAYIEAEKYFLDLLRKDRNKECKGLKRIIEDEFDESQQILIIPATTFSAVAVIQSENSKFYEQALKDTYRNKPDNTITKLAMLRFGLPIAPLSPINVRYYATIRDLPEIELNDKSIDEDIPQRREVWFQEKPLEFLDGYHRQIYGYPLVRNGNCTCAFYVAREF
jgi:hypothetical protein